MRISGGYNVCPCKGGRRPNKNSRGLFISYLNMYVIIFLAMNALIYSCVNLTADKTCFVGIEKSILKGKK